MSEQELAKIALRMQSDGRYAAAGWDGKTLWSNTFSALAYARRYVADCSAWVIVEDYEVIEQSPDSHADYPGGSAQYAADVETLTEAGALAGKATRGEWKWGVKHGTRYGDVMTALESEDTDGECFDIIELGSLPHMWIFSNADADLILNAATTARAAARFMPWVLGKLEVGR